MTTVVRKINGKDTKLTPTENFIYAVDKWLKYAEYQFGLLAKKTGPQYEHTEQMLDVIEQEIDELKTAALKQLRNPTAKASGTDYAKKLRKA